MSEPSQNNSETPADNAEASNSASEQVAKVENQENQLEQCNHQEESQGNEHSQPENRHHHHQHDQQPETKSESEEGKDKAQQEEHQSNGSSDESRQDKSADQLVQVAEGVVKEILEAADAQHLTEILSENDKNVQADGKEEHQNEKSSGESTKENQHTSTVGTSPIKTVSETEEVTSTTKDHQPRSGRSARRPSYTSGRGYAGGYQNYGLTYLPYKSNFEPSEDARRKADEFFKTLKLQ